GETTRPHARVQTAIRLEEQRVLDREQVRGSRLLRLREVLERTDIVENVDPPPVRSDDEVVRARLNDEIVDRHPWNAMRQLGPVRTAVDREEDTELRAGEQEVRLPRVLTHDLRRAAGRQVAGDRSPGLTVVVALVDVRREIVA